MAPSGGDCGDRLAKPGNIDAKGSESPEQLAVYELQFLEPPALDDTVAAKPAGVVFPNGQRGRGLQCWRDLSGYLRSRAN